MLVSTLGSRRILRQFKGATSHMAKSQFAQYLIEWAKFQDDLISTAKLTRITRQTSGNMTRWLADDSDRLPEIETMISIYEATKQYDLEHPHNYRWGEPGIPLRLLLALKPEITLPLAEDAWNFLIHKTEDSEHMTAKEKESRLEWIRTIQSQFNGTSSVSNRRSKAG